MRKIDAFPSKYTKVSLFAFLSLPMRKQVLRYVCYEIHNL